jgi:hypothetical protein
VLDDPRRAAGLLSNKDAMARLLHECRENHKEHAGNFADVRRERNLATDHVLEAIRAGGVEPRTLVSIIDRSASQMSQESTPVIGVAPIPFNDSDGRAAFDPTQGARQFRRRQGDDLGQSSREGQILGAGNNQNPRLHER